MSNDSNDSNVLQMLQQSVQICRSDEIGIQVPDIAGLPSGGLAT